jgi:geranylgeranyl transferase type-2 subunit alpha
VKLIRALQDDAIRRRREKVYDATSMAVTARLLEINPEVLTAWNFRREAIVFAGDETRYERRRAERHRDGVTTNDPERTTPSVFAPLLADELALTERCLRKHPKSYPAWHHRKWCVARRVRVPRGDGPRRTAETESTRSNDFTNGFADARGFPVASLLATELAMAQALLDLDDRNFHGWGYRRFVTSLANDGALETRAETRSAFRATERETPERTPKPEASSTRDHDRDRATLSDEASEASEASARAELRYSEAKIERNFSNYSAWHHRAANLPRAFAGPTNGHGASRDGGVPADVLANEYAFVRQAFFTEPEDQAGWMYHRWLTAQTKNANEAFAAPGEDAAAAKRAVFAGEADALRELCALEPDCKWPALTLARLCDLQGTEAGAAESAARFAELARLDPARRGFYCDCCRV